MPCWTSLPSPVISTTGHCFCFGSVSSLFLELFLHSSPVAYWAPTDLDSSSFSVVSLCLFILFHTIQSRRVCTHLLLRELQNYNLLLNNHQQENVGCNRKKTPHVQQQRISPSKVEGGEKSHLESNPIPTRDTRRSQTKPCVHQDPEPPQRPANCRAVIQNKFSHC